MILSDLSIKRPVFATVMVLALVTLGAFSYRWLPVEMYPNVEIPVISIVTKFPGASPESVEREVSKRLEEAVNGISGVKHVYSYSREGVSTVVVEFRLEERLNEVIQEARAKVNGVRGTLPKGIEDPIIQKMDISAIPVVSLAIQSQTLSPRDLTVLVEKNVKRRFEGIAGVGKVDLVGASKREVNVIIDPERLSALGLGIDAVVAGLKSENVNTPLGRLNRGATEVNLRVSGKPDRVEKFREMAIAERGGRPIRLGEVAQVKDGVEEQRSLGLVDGVPAVSLDVIKQAGANIVEVADSVKATAAGLKAELPPGTTIRVVRDSSVFTRESLEDVRQTLILGGLLTVLIVFCFINSWRSTVITGLTLPISVISSFLLMKALGMSINVMTMMALSLAVGLLIDDAIVVRENIVRHLERGEDHFAAARNGTSEIGLAVFATSMSIVAVFVPVAFMKGIVGRFFFQFGMTVAFAVLVSLFVSFTLDPMLSSRWFDPAIAARGSRRGLAGLLEKFNSGFDRVADTYRGAVGWALDHRKAVLTLALVAFVGGLSAFGSLQSAFFPDIDSGEFNVTFKTAPDASIDESRGRLEALLAEIRVNPAVGHTYATIGAGDNGTVRSGVIFVKLKDRSERRAGQKEVQQEFRRRFMGVPGIVTSIEEVDESGQSRKPLQVNLRGTDISRLKAYAGELRDQMYAIRGIRDIEISMEHDIPEYRMTVDRERALTAGVKTDAIVQTVGALIGGEVVSTYEDADGDAVDIRVRLPGTRRQNPDQVRDLRLAVADPGRPATLIPLANLVSYTAWATPSEINRQELSRQVTIGANLENLPLGTAVEKVREAAGKLALEPGYRVVFTGDAADMAESFGYMAESLILAVLFVYFILAAQFESFLEPLAIMFSLPLSIVGMAGLLFLTGDTINIMSLIGLIMLMGLVTKNAILLVDYAKVLRRRGIERREAVITAGRTRLRPIVMTTLAMIFGMMPLALGMGAGAEIRAPMARAVVGGLLTSTLLTLLVVPVMYTLMEDLGGWLAGKLGFRRHELP
ncbi:MAG: efflux RND transporter permease subunit [Deltaproteobacteria bacterium]|nr:efflux RND transporter permease subunit [Deltaproteobacteria bacterium]